MTTKQHGQLVNILVAGYPVYSGLIKRIDGTTDLYNDVTQAYYNIQTGYNTFNSGNTSCLDWDTNTNSNNTNATYIVIGSGNTSPTKDDYVLEAMYDTSETIEVSKYVSNVGHEEKNQPYRLYVSSIKNLTESNIIVREVGLLLRLGFNNYLLTRDVLDSSVTIPAAATKEFSVKLYW